ncbi:MAG: DUF3300 domain-containing protein [Acetobacteraceae bacterium]|nr:DUF3300 domain-containing protein [Acetobacteraceae bacterium]
MSGRFFRLAACCLVLHASLPGVAWGQQSPKPNAAQANETVQTFNTEQIDALLAPIALYPDTLLTQILMASTFPLQVVAAGRWLEEPAHKEFKGDALTQALEAQDWDPSVKSLVPFPQVLTMMNANLDWVQQLGYAVADQQAAVLDSVQRLRRQAQSNGGLQSSPQQVVRTEGQSIVIEPAEPNVVYVPSYNPTVVYGTWPYPSYPPVYLPPPAGYVAGTALLSGLAFGAGVAITAGLWGWARPAWGSGHVDVNVNRYNNINASRAMNSNRAVNRAAMSSNVWQPNRAGGRPAGLTRPPAGPVGRPARQNGLPAGAIGRQQVSVPGSAVRPSAPARSEGAAGTARGQSAVGRAAGQAGQTNRAGLGQGGPTSRSGSGQSVSRTNLGNRPSQLSAGNRAGQPSAFSGMNNGRQATQFGQRGAQSRSMSQARRPSGGFNAARAGGRAGARGGRAGGRR